MKRFLRFVLLLAALAAVAVIASRLRSRADTAPAAGLPGVDRHRSAAPGPAEEKAASDEPNDLTRVRGIGPVYRARLNEAGITTFAELADAGPAAVIEAAGVTSERAADWIAQAGTLAGH